MSNDLNFEQLAISDRALLAKTTLPVGGIPQDVRFVARVGEDKTADYDNARYYASPLIARTAFEDLTKGVDPNPNFQGRTRDELQTFLSANTK